MHHIFWSLIILFLFAVLMQVEWAYYLVYVVGGIWLLSHWSVRRSADKLQITRTVPERAFAGQRVEAKVAIANQSWLPIAWLLLQERVPVELRDEADYQIVLSVGSHSQVEHSYSFNCRQRGYFPIGPLSVNSGDLFGFAQSDWRENEKKYLLVYPQIVSLSQLGLPSRTPFGQLAAPNRMYEDPARLNGVRLYASGDSLRRVHWKATAHTNTLLVKKFQPAIALSVVIVLEMNRNHYPIREVVSGSEWGIIVTASIANAVCEQRQPVGLISNGIDVISKSTLTPLQPRNGQEQLVSILTRLARVQLSNNEGNPSHWLAHPLGELGWGTTLVVVTPQLDEDTLWLLHQTYRRGAEILVLVCAQQTDFILMQARARQLGIEAKLTVWERDLKEL
ncbi:MAG: DUF58 domain-containing protein [Caldilineaceae bacterium]